MLTKDDIVELLIVVVVSAALVGFFAFATTSFPVIYDVRDYPELDLEITLE